MKEARDLMRSAARMERDIAALLPDCPVFWKAETGSTNEDAREGALTGKPSGSVFGAEKQTRGRGRLTRQWNSGEGEAVEMSFLFRPEAGKLEPAGFSFAAALGIADGVEQTAGLSCRIKWPNDVVAEGRKICGILCESATLGNQAAFMVIGTGINVNQTVFPREIASRASSLRLLTGRISDRAEAAAACIAGVKHWVSEFLENGLPALETAYTQRSAVLGREVEVLKSAQIYAGRCVGFNKDGAILVEGSDGVQAFHASDVSLRGAGLHV